MKKKFLCILILSFFCGFYCMAQINPATNSYRKLPALPNPSDKSFNTKETTNSIIPCTPNMFLMATIQHTLEAFELNGTTVTYVGIANPDNLDYLAMRANNLCDTAPNPTYFSAFNNAPIGQAGFYNNFNWTYCTGYNPNRYFANGGGNGNYIFYTADTFTSLSHAIERYDGTTFTPIYHAPPFKIFIIADIAVDDNGNVWFFTGDSTTWMSEYLHKISPSGVLLAQYPVVFNGFNGYGTFILNNKIYAGLGPDNPINPNTLIPVSLLDTLTAVMEPPIPFPDSTGIDFEGCMIGLLTANKELNFYQSISISPNPCTNKIIIESKEKISSILITDVSGVTLNDIQFSEPANSKLGIDTSKLLPGAYILKIGLAKNLIVRKIIKI